MNVRFFTSVKNLYQEAVMQTDFKKIGKAVKDNRIKKGLSQTQFAERVNISVPYLSNIESGAKQPSLDILISIANELQVTVDELLVGTQSYDKASYIVEMTRVLGDCTEQEKRLILSCVVALKAVLSENR